MDGIVVERGLGEADRDAVVAMLREYEAGLGVSLCFQDFEAEVAGLPGAYAHRAGRCCWRAPLDGAIVGIIALRPVLDVADACEMKRLYVCAAARGLGRTLALAVMEEARRLGYRRTRLDTLPAMTEARALYARWVHADRRQRR
jgi:GNAT superfamily N-acetyltransferase